MGIQELDQSGDLFIPVTYIDVQFIFNHLLGEASSPELGKEALGVLEVLVELLEESFSSEALFIDERVDLGGGPLQLLGYRSELVLKDPC